MPEARTLLYDIETSPNLAYTWGKYQQDVLRFANEWHMLCFAYAWLDDPEVKVVALPDFRKAYKADPTDDFRVVERLHGLFEEADIIVAHNGNSFDQNRANARFLVHGLDPPQPYRQIDTCLNARKYFSFNSNKLGDLAESLGIGVKGETGGFQTWVSCLAGDKAAWQQMKDYNAQDVVLLREVYLRMRPWIDGHPSVAMITGALDACPKCGSTNLTRQGFKFNRVSTVQQWKCGDCRGWSSSRVAERDLPKPTLVN